MRFNDVGDLTVEAVVAVDLEEDILELAPSVPRVLGLEEACRCHEEC